MQFDRSEEHERYRQNVLQFARRELSEENASSDEDGRFSREVWERCASFGIQGLPVPEDYGGGGRDALTLVIALEALANAYPDNGLLFSLSSHICSCEIPILLFGTPDQRGRYLPGLAGGKLVGAQAVTEAGAGSDVFSISTTARRCASGYVLNGSKTFVTDGPVADLYVIYASVDPDAGPAGLSAFIVPRDASGLRVGPPIKKLGLRSAPMAELELTDCELPDEGLLGTPGAGMAVFYASADWERGCAMAGVVGGMERQLDRCVSHARSRRQFGQPIGNFQAVSHRIAEMQVRLEAACLLLYKWARLKSGDQSTRMAAAVAKLYVSEAFVQSSLDALQISGGTGYLSGGEDERNLRDAVGFRIASGTSEIQRNLIARYLGVG